MITTTVTVTTVGGTTFTFTGDAGVSAMRSIANKIAIDADTTVEGDTTRIIIPFNAINHALTTIETSESEAVEDANCVTRTPAEEGGGD